MRSTGPVAWSSTTTPRRCSPTPATSAPRPTSRARSGSRVPDRGRIHFQEELAKLEEAAPGGLDLVVGAVDRALETVKHQDVELASMVIADDDRIDGRYLEVHQGILSLLAL